jgi:hypothetical protein
VEDSATKSVVLVRV